MPPPLRHYGTLIALVLALGSPLAEAAKVGGTMDSEVPSWFAETFFDLGEDSRAAAQSGKVLMIYFHQPRCPYCAALVNNNFSQRHIVQYMRKNIVALEMNMWGDREITGFDGKAYNEKAFAARHKVWFTPTLLFFDGNGKIILRINGYFPPHKFMTALRFIGEKHYKTMRFRDYFAKHSPIQSAGKLHAEPFFLAPPLDLSTLGRTKPLIVFFEQRDCPRCDVLHQKIFKERATRDQLARFDVVQLDLWDDATEIIAPNGRRMTARKWAKRLGIVYAPSAVLFHNGAEVIRIEAFMKAFHTQSVMDYVASKAYQRQPSLQRFISARAQRLLGEGKEVDLWKE